MNARAFPRYIEKAATAEVDAADPRTMRFVASDESVDRYGDVIVAKGWQLEQFRRNPVLLWAHDATAPIGTVPEVEIKGKRLLATVRFTDEGINPQADLVAKLVQAKELRAVSVGFTVGSADDVELIRDERNDNVTGYRYMKTELLELSVVAIPANPNALALAKSLGLPEPFINSAVMLDALVSEQHAQRRRRLREIILAGHRYNSPRLVVTHEHKRQQRMKQKTSDVIAEQVKARGLNVAAMTELFESTNGAPFNADQSRAYDELDNTVKEIDEYLDRLAGLNP